MHVTFLDSHPNLRRWCGSDLQKSDVQSGQSRFQGDLVQPRSNRTQNPLAANETQPALAATPLQICQADGVWTHLHHNHPGRGGASGASGYSSNANGSAVELQLKSRRGSIKILDFKGRNSQENHQPPFFPPIKAFNQPSQMRRRWEATRRRCTELWDLRRSNRNQRDT